MEEQNTNESSMPNQEGEGKNGGMGGKIVGLVIVVLVIALGVYALTRGSKDDDGITPEAASTQNEEATEATGENASVTAPVPAEGINTPETNVVATGQTVTVVFTEAGYAPGSVTIKKGDSVMFRNDSALETWPASAMHPTHTVYPGSDIQKCGTAEQGSIFDACRGLKNGETYIFQFNNVGKWNYHDHINSGKYGSIEVTE